MGSADAVRRAATTRARVILVRLWPPLDTAAHVESRCRCGYRTAKQRERTMCRCGVSIQCVRGCVVRCDVCGALSKKLIRQERHERRVCIQTPAERMAGRNASWHAQTLGGAALCRTPEAQSRCRCGGVSPVSVQMWRGKPSLGADVAACLLSQRGRRLSVAALRLCGSLDFVESREWPASVATKYDMERECPNDATHAAGTVAE